VALSLITGRAANIVADNKPRALEKKRLQKAYMDRTSNKVKENDISFTRVSLSKIRPTRKIISFSMGQFECNIYGI
jgi:uncharacterized protein (DUF2249 family)